MMDVNIRGGRILLDTHFYMKGSREKVFLDHAVYFDYKCEQYPLLHTEIKINGSVKWNE